MKPLTPLGNGGCVLLTGCHAHSLATPEADLLALSILLLQYGSAPRWRFQPIALKPRLGVWAGVQSNGAGVLRVVGPGETRGKQLCGSRILRRRHKKPDQVQVVSFNSSPATMRNFAISQALAFFGARLCPCKPKSLSRSRVDTSQCCCARRHVNFLFPMERFTWI
jgi:hypothetical protein